MKKNRLFAALLCLLLVLTSVMLPAAATEEPSSNSSGQAAQLPSGATFSEQDTVTYGCHTPDARYAIYGSDSLVRYSGAAILYEVTSDTLVYTYNADQQLYPSSLVKIMTALLALEHGDLTETVTASWQALDSVPISALKAGLYSGEELTLEELLYCMLVGSANDAAVVIAHHISGNQENFVARMNSRAAELGCTGTHFVNATGLHDEAQVTTARDMVRILRQALEYPEFAEIFGATTYTLRATNKYEERTFRTTNYMMIPGSTSSSNYDSRVTGGRTGVTDSNLRCLAVTAQDGGALYISVVMNSKPEYAADGSIFRHGTYEDTATLLELAFEKSRLVQVFRQGQIVDQAAVVNGANDAALGPNEVAACVLPVDVSDNQLTTRIQMNQSVLTAPVEAERYVAQCQVWYGNICIAHGDLYTKNAVAAVEVQVQPSAPAEERGFDAGALSTAFMVLGIVFLVLILFVGGLFLVRFIRGTMRNARIRSRRKDRRRSK